MKYFYIKCPHCNAQYRLADLSKLNKQVVCSKCSQGFNLSLERIETTDKLLEGSRKRTQPSEQSAAAAPFAEVSTAGASTTGAPIVEKVFARKSPSGISIVDPITDPVVQSQLTESSQSRVGWASKLFFEVLAGKNTVASLTSLILHVAMILFLAICVIVPELQNQTQSISLAAAAVDKGPEAELVSFDLSEAVPNLQLASVDLSQSVTMDSVLPEISIDVALDIPPSVQIETASESDADDPVASVDELAMAADTKAASKANRSKRSRPKSSIAWIPTISKKGVNIREPLLVQPKDGLRQTGSASTAASGVMDKLSGSIGQDGPVAIIWLMDASLSLLEERQALAPQVFNFYEGLRAKAKESRLRLKTSVFAFGQQIVPIEMNLGFLDPSAVAQAIHNLPIDQTGLENVMSAVSMAVNSVPTYPPNTRIEVVVWTDESGDDLAMLEDVIQLCRQRQARIHVVGPLSVFGMEGGLQQFTLPAPNRWSVLLPVKRGPDSAFPERAQLPLWHDSQDVNWGSDTLIPAGSSLQNLGGPHRQLLLAPSGPYALTRLALATGGSYTALNRAGDLAAAGREQLFEYMPDYRSGMQIAYDIDKYPLRKAIIEAAALTGTANYWPPARAYPSRIYHRFPYNPFVFYSPPQRFAQELKLQLAVNVQRLLGPQKTIEQAIQIMLLRFNDSSYAGSNNVDSEKGLELADISLESITTSEYDQEESPRWRAWYDLNLGRLLAHSVRISEYISHCKRLAEPDVKQSLLDREINCITIEPSATIIGGSACIHRMDLSMQLLKRVIEKHPNTPWSDLAAWELQSAFGMEPRPSIIPPPVPVTPLPAQPRPELPRL